MDDLIREEELLIGGEWVPAEGNEREVESPATEQTVGLTRDAGSAQVDAAVQAAHAALNGWASRSAEERAVVLENIADALEAEAERFAGLITAELGTPAPLARSLHVDVPASVIRRTIEALRDYSFSSVIGNSHVVQQPTGVLAAITPWNLPLHQIVVKIVPAIAAGATVVLKPAALTPLTAYALARLMHENGLPAGVLNIVTGSGASIGEQLIEHPLVRHVSFTGSTEVGRKVGARAAAAVKRVTLELGGKSPSVVLSDVDDATLVKAVKLTVANCYLNSGQTCTALTRLVVPESRLAEAERIAAESAAKYLPGGRLGPLASASQRESVSAFLSEEATLGARDLGPSVELPQRGYYVAPHVFTRVEPHARIAREEIFGPVLSILTARDDAEAVSIANDSEYGLAAAVWSGSEEHAVEVAREIQAGQVDVNGGAFNTGAPFGGFKNSGIGREIGLYGIADVLETKSIQL